jgi:signal transduction histidine kinase
MISITDNGSGIPEAYVERMFSMFSRGNNKSTGLAWIIYCKGNHKHAKGKD